MTAEATNLLSEEPRCRAPGPRSLRPGSLTRCRRSDILRSSPFAHRDIARIVHAPSAAHLAAPKLAFNPQAQPLAR